MITKLSDSQSFSEILKTAARQKFCAMAWKIWPCNIIRGPLREHILFAHPTNFTASIEKNYIGCLELRLKTCNNVKSVIVWNASFRLASLSFKNTGRNNQNNSTIFNRWIEASVLEVITSRKLQHILRSYKHETFQEVKYKLHLIEQPYLNKIHSR